MASSAMGVQGNPAAGAWSSGLCDCFDDVGGCCLTFFCPCVTFGRIAGIVDEGATSCCASGALYFLLSAVTGLGCLYSCCYRARLRTQYGLAETPCADCCVHLCCGACALCQEYRELKARGFDMYVHRMAGQHGEDGESWARRCNRPAPDVSRDVTLVRASACGHPCSVKLYFTIHASILSCVFVSTYVFAGAIIVSSHCLKIMLSFFFIQSCGQLLFRPSSQ